MKVTVILTSELCSNSTVILYCVKTTFETKLTEVISENSLITVTEKIYSQLEVKYTASAS